MLATYGTRFPNLYSALGLSSDTKPISLVDYSSFREIDTDKLFISLSGIWTLVNNPGYVNSVSGTLNRILITGTIANPIVDISPNYVGQSSITTLGTIGSGTWQGTAITDTYISSASTWNAKESALTFSTGLTRTTNTITNTLSIGISGGQSVIGGTAVGDILTIKGTTANGTSTVGALSFAVGNNGTTIAATMYNSGNINIGNASNTNARLFRVGQDTAIVDIGSNQGSTGSGAIYFNATTPSSTNYAIQGTSTTTSVNGPTTSIDYRIAGTVRYLMTNFAHTFTVAGSGSVVTQYSFTGIAANALTASTETVGANFNFAQNLQHATGALALNRDVLIQARTHAAIAASTITDAATLGITSSPFSNTNVTITNSHGILVQTANVQTAGAVTNSYGITVNAMTGGTNNYSAQFLGGSLLTNSDFKLTTAGNGIYVKQGTNATCGRATLTAGTVTVSTTKATSTCEIFLTDRGGTVTNLGTVYISAVSSGTSFTITSTNILDASTISWLIIEAA